MSEPQKTQKPQTLINTGLVAYFILERVTGIEPATSAWEADVLPLNYTRRYCQARLTVIIIHLLHQ